LPAQSALLKDYPNKMLVTVTQCVFSTVQSFVVAVVAEKDFSKWKLRLDISLIAIFYTVTIIDMLCFFSSSLPNQGRSSWLITTMKLLMTHFFLLHGWMIIIELAVGSDRVL
jgi:hypothetical protein